MDPGPPERRHQLSPPGLLATLHYDLPAGINAAMPLSERWTAHVQIVGEFKAGLKALIVSPTAITLTPTRGARSTDRCGWI